MRSSTTYSQVSQLFDHQKGSDLTKAEKPKPRLELTWLDRLPIEVLVADDVTNLIEDARLCAAALAGDDRDEARMRVLARLISTTRSQHVLLETKLNQCAVKRDHDGVDILSKALKGAAQRLALLMMEHRISCASGRHTAPVVVVGNVARVTASRGGTRARRLPR